MTFEEVPDLGHELDDESQIWDMNLEEVPDLGHENARSPRSGRCQ